MNTINIGSKIKKLRRQKNISQEILGQYLGISFQAISKWENGTAMPDIAMIPAIASFFGISTDELFDYNLLENEKNILEICNQAIKAREREPERAEHILREGLKRYPGNDVILNNLLYLITDDREEEKMEICRMLVKSTKHDDVKYDALRIIAEIYKKRNEMALCKETIDKIPEIYFSNLQLKAMLLEGDDMYYAAVKEKNIAADTLIEMLVRLAEYYEAGKQKGKALRQYKIAKQTIEAFCGEEADVGYKQGIFEYEQNKYKMIEKKIEMLEYEKKVDILSMFAYNSLQYIK